MTSDSRERIGRRTFLRVAGAAAAALPAASVAGAQTAAAPAGSKAPGSPAAPLAGYQSLSLDEAAFTEALIDHMWPADELTPSGTELGIVTFIDRQLAGAFGHGDRLYLQGPFRKGKPQHGYQLPLTPEQFFKAGVAACNAASQRRFSGRDFDRLRPSEREPFLAEVAGGRAQAGGFPLAEWFNGLVYPLFLQGAFADPIYGGNRDKATWRMIGYPGLPALYALDVVRYRGRAHPRSQAPRSIQDLS